MLTAQCRGTQQAESTTPWWVRCSSSYGSLLALVDSRSRRILGYSAEEYRRIIDATLVLFGVTAFLSVVLELDLAGGHLAIALPLGLIGLLVNRRIWRGVAARKRVKGEYQKSLLVVGSRGCGEITPRAGAGLLRGRPLHAGGPDFAGRPGPDRLTRCPGRSVSIRPSSTP